MIVLVFFTSFASAATLRLAASLPRSLLAVASVSQAAKETEASSSQTLQTSSQLSGLSKELGRLIQPQATA